MGTKVIHNLCSSVSVPWIARKHCCLWVSLTMKICRTPYCIVPPLPVPSTCTFMTNSQLYHLATLTACFSFSVELAGWAFCLIDLVLTTIDFVEYCLLLCSHTTHAKLLSCYGYMMAIRILPRSQCCHTLVTSSSHCCLCMHHVHVALL